MLASVASTPTLAVVAMEGREGAVADGLSRWTVVTRDEGPGNSGETRAFADVSACHEHTQDDGTQWHTWACRHHQPT